MKHFVLKCCWLYRIQKTSLFSLRALTDPTRVVRADTAPGQTTKSPLASCDTSWQENRRWRFQLSNKIDIQWAFYEVFIFISSTCWEKNPSSRRLVPVTLYKPCFLGVQSSWYNLRGWLGVKKQLSNYLSLCPQTQTQCGWLSLFVTTTVRKRYPQTPYVKLLQFSCSGTCWIKNVNPKMKYRDSVERR